MSSLEYAMFIRLLGTEKREKSGMLSYCTLISFLLFNILIQKFNAISLHITDKE